MKTYHGPVSDHFDGIHFFDPDGAPPKSLGDVLRWQFGDGRQRAKLAGLGTRRPHSDTPPPRGRWRQGAGCRSSAMPAG